MTKGLMKLKGPNPYHQQVQGKANEPITVAALLDRARTVQGLKVPKVNLGDIYDRLDENCPRIAIISGSPDHPAHIVDTTTVLRLAVEIWEAGGVPFSFGIPVLCDGTAQSTIGMCYSLASRNLLSDLVVNQLEAHSYHSVIALSGCDKSPFGILNGLSNLDHTRIQRNDHPLHASFIPTHVLKGGIVPQSLREDLLELAAVARKSGHINLATDIEETLTYTLQCTTNQAFQGILSRAVQLGMISLSEHARFEKELAVATCDAAGGICSFYGTGNSSRVALSALGMVHPEVEFLTEPPTQSQVRSVVQSLFKIIPNPEYSVSNIISKNIENTIKVHNCTGGSTNLVMHLIALMNYSGYRFDLWDYQRIRNAQPIPDLFDYSFNEGRDIFALAQQCCSGQVHGVESILKSLIDNEINISLSAPTVSAHTWKERLVNLNGNTTGKSNFHPIILSKPKRSISGVEVLRGNFFESAILKMGGFSDQQIADFDDKVFYVLYFESEDDANQGLMDARLIHSLKQQKSLSKETLLSMIAANRRDSDPSLETASQLNRSMLFDMMIERELFKVAVVISGQGPEAFGMPEMFTPMHHINNNMQLRKLTILLSDGRFSGVTYGAAIGHVTPEAIKSGHILYLRTGDLLRLQMGLKRVELLDPARSRNGKLEPYNTSLERERYVLGTQRLQRMEKRRELISATNRLENVTDAGGGVVPERIARLATRKHASRVNTYKIRNTRRVSETAEKPSN